MSTGQASSRNHLDLHKLAALQGFVQDAAQVTSIAQKTNELHAAAERLGYSADEPCALYTSLPEPPQRTSAQSLQQFKSLKLLIPENDAAISQESPSGPMSVPIRTAVQRGNYSPSPMRSRTPSNSGASSCRPVLMRTSFQGSEHLLEPRKNCKTPVSGTSGSILNSVGPSIPSERDSVGQRSPSPLLASQQQRRISLHQVPVEALAPDPNSSSPSSQRESTSGSTSPSVQSIAVSPDSSDRNSRSTLRIEASKGPTTTSIPPRQTPSSPVSGTLAAASFVGRAKAIWREAANILKDQVEADRQLLAQGNAPDKNVCLIGGAPRPATSSHQGSAQVSPQIQPKPKSHATPSSERATSETSHTGSKQLEFGHTKQDSQSLSRRSSHAQLSLNLQYDADSCEIQPKRISSSGLRQAGSRRTSIAQVDIGSQQLPQNSIAEMQAAAPPMAKSFRRSPKKKPSFTDMVYTKSGLNKQRPGAGFTRRSTTAPGFAQDECVGIMSDGNVTSGCSTPRSAGPTPVTAVAAITTATASAMPVNTAGTSFLDRIANSSPGAVSETSHAPASSHPRPTTTECTSSPESAPFKPCVYDPTCVDTASKREVQNEGERRMVTSVAQYKQEECKNPDFAAHNEAVKQNLSTLASAAVVLRAKAASKRPPSGALTALSISTTPGQSTIARAALHSARNAIQGKATTGMGRFAGQSDAVAKALASVRDVQNYKAT